MTDIYNNSGATEGKVVDFPENLIHPRDYEAPKTNSDQSRGPVGGIQELSVDQIFNNSGQGKGPAGPAVWGGPTDDKASQSSAEAGTNQDGGYNVDLVSGQHDCWNGGRPYKG